MSNTAPEILIVLNREEMVNLFAGSERAGILDKFHMSWPERGLGRTRRFVIAR